MPADELEYVMSQLARGNPRGDVVKMLIKESPDRYPDTDIAFRRKLSGHLRRHDPSSKGFAEKYYAMLNLHRETIAEEMGTLYKEQYESLRDNILLRVDRQAENLSSIDRKIELFDDQWFQAMELGKRQKSMPWVQCEHNRLIEIDKQMQKWHEIRSKEEEHLIKLFFPLKGLEMKMFDRIPA